jgi:pyrroloquinoline quinone biosynthesis protein D
VSERTTITAASVPRLPPHIKLRFDAVRQRWTLLAPERVLVPDEIATEVLQCCDGVRTVGTIAETLARKYEAAVDEVQGDIIARLQELADKGAVAA